MKYFENDETTLPTKDQKEWYMISISTQNIGLFVLH